MRRVISVSIMLLLTVFSVAGSQQSQGSRLIGPIVYLNSQRLASESVIGKEGLNRILVLQKEKQEELRSRQLALEDLRRQIPLSADAPTRQRLQEQEQRQQAELARAAAQAQADVQNLQRQTSTELRTKLRSVLDELLKGKDVKVALTSESVLWAAPELDVTDLALERLNAHAPGSALPKK